VNAFAVVPVLREAADRWVADRCTRLGAALSYYAIFSLFPLALLSVTAIGFLLGDRASGRAEVVAFFDTGSPQIRELLDQTLTNLQEHRGARGVSAVVGVLTLLFGASGVFSELDNALAVIWRVPLDARSSPWQSVLAYGRDRAVAFLLVATAALLLLASLALSLALGAFGHATGAASLGTWTTWLWTIIEFVFSTAFLAVVFSALFRLLPREHLAWRYALSGGTLASVLVALLKRGLGYYLAHFGNFAAYGVVGAMLALLTWIYVTTLAIFFGAEVTRVCAERGVRRAVTVLPRPGKARRPVSVADPDCGARGC
jgi:membrane protein